MRAYIVPKGCTGVDELRLDERPDPRPGPGQVLVRLRAASLNYRDQAVIAGRYYGGVASRDMIPLSDAAGEVLAVGEGVARVKPGDRVCATFTQVPPDGPRSAAALALGSPLDGVLAELAVFYEDGVVPMPPGYSFEEAACLPCAALTAWSALMVAGGAVHPGQSVLILGTGGVSLFGLQFARAAGCRVIVTSSSDEKLERARSLGASDGINYRTTPDWDKAVMRVTGGRGVDAVVEVGGTGTLARSFHSLAQGGKVGLIGVLTGPDGNSNPHTLMMRNASLHGIRVGDRAGFLDMIRAIEVNQIEPVIDRVFPFEAAAEAYRYQASPALFGKVVIGL